MLDKIKVYRRSDASEVKLYKIAYSEEKVYLEIYENSFLEICKPLLLTKFDPLNKFKKEMEGWRFSDKYVVYCEGSLLTCLSYKTHSYRIIYTLPNGGARVTDGVITEQAYTELTGIKDSLEEWKSPSYAIGEEKYLKLLEFIDC